MSGGVVAITVALLAFNAFFVGAEFAAMSARRSQLEPLAEAGSKRAQMALDALHRTGLLLATCQLGITVCSVLLGAVTEASLHHALVPLIDQMNPDAVHEVTLKVLRFFSQPSAAATPVRSVAPVAKLAQPSRTISTWGIPASRNSSLTILKPSRS